MATSVPRDRLPQTQQTGMLDERASLAFPHPAPTGETSISCSIQPGRETASNEFLRGNLSTEGGVKTTEPLCTESFIRHPSEGNDT